MVILSTNPDDWVCISVLSVVWMRRPAQGATGGCVMLALVFKWFLLCEFSYLILPRVSSLEKAMAPHSSALAWKTHGWRSLVGCSPWGR